MYPIYVAQEVENEMISGVRNVCRIGVWRAQQVDALGGSGCFLAKKNDGFKMIKRSLPFIESFYTQMPINKWRV